MDSYEMRLLLWEKPSSGYLGYYPNFDYVCGRRRSGVVYTQRPKSESLERAIYVKLYAFSLIGNFE